VQLSPDHSLDPAKKGGKEGVLEEASAGWQMQKCTWLEVTQGRAYPRRQLAECPRAVPYLRSHVSRRVFAFAARCKYWEEKEEEVKIFSREET
jgi:hypothetical protein